MTPAAFVGLMRPFTLLAPVVGVGAAAGAASVVHDEPWFSGPLLAACVAAVAATGASNAWNQVFDLHADRRNKPHRPLPSGRVTKRGAMAVGDLLALLAALLAALVSPAFLACVAFSLLATWAYSAPPLRLKRRTIPALVCIAISRGLLIPVAGWSAIAVPGTSDPWALGAVIALFVLGAAATKDFSDLPGDREDGCQTLPIRFGSARAARIIAPFYVVPFALYPVFGAIGWIHVPTWRLSILAFGLVLLGGAAGLAMVRDPEGLAAGERRHAAWRGMYLLMLASQVGTYLVYAL